MSRGLPLLAVLPLILLFSGQASAATLMEQARENTLKRAGTFCDRHGPCRDSGVEACWKPRPGLVSCRAFGRVTYGPEPSDDVIFRARFAWGREDGEVTLFNRTGWR